MESPRPTSLEALRPPVSIRCQADLEPGRETSSPHQALPKRQMFKGRINISAVLSHYVLRVACDVLASQKSVHPKFSNHNINTGPARGIK